MSHPSAMLAPMGPELRSLAARAAEQHGVVSRRQVVALGVSRRSLDRALEGGLLVEAGNHSWRFAGTPLSWRASLQAGLFDLGPHALVGGRSAAALLGLDGFEEGSARVRRPAGAARPPGRWARAIDP